jgi:hypothetical protein
LRFNVDRYRESERRSVPQFGLGPKPAAVHLDDPLGDCKPEPSLEAWRLRTNSKPIVSQ